MKLDLHGKYHHDISNFVDQFIWEAMKSKEHQIEIITGNSEKMKELVIEIVKDYNFKYQIGDASNNGYVKVYLYDYII